MLAVLSEIHCLDYLNDRGIFPDEYFTDFELFKNRCISYKDATIVIIVAGTCQFNRRHLVELIKQQYKRVDNEADSGIRNVFVLSDSYIHNLDMYYKFQDNMDIFKEFSGMKCVSGDIDVWAMVDDFQTDKKHQTIVNLSNYDTGKIDGILDKLKNTVSSEDKLIHLIKKPNVKSLILGK